MLNKIRPVSYISHATTRRQISSASANMIMILPEDGKIVYMQCSRAVCSIEAGAAHTPECMKQSRGTVGGIPGNL